MNRFSKPAIMLLIGVCVILIGIKLTAQAPQEEVPETAGVPEDTASMAKVAASDKSDGEYYVYITSVDQSPEDTTLTMKHVTYFEGPEARVSAANEVQCEEAIENCVPTLRAGYYVRESGAPVFNAPLLKSAAIGATIATQATKDPKTVYIVTIKDGNVVRVMQVTK